MVFSFFFTQKSDQNDQNDQAARNAYDTPFLLLQFILN
jgi:hypothetical protein